MSKRFAPDELAKARDMPLSVAIKQLGYHHKADLSFKPLKNSSTQRWHISKDARVIELLVTGDKWFAAKDERGGGGAIDLAIYLANLNFVGAVKRLLK